MNALAHATAGLVAKYPAMDEMRFQDFVDADGGVHPNISDNSFIILRADNANKLRALRRQCIENDIAFTDFTSSMTAGTYAEQHTRTRAIPEAELEYYAVVLFGDAAKLQEITKKYSLWR